VTFVRDRNAICTDSFTGEYQKKVINLIARNNFDKQRGISAKRKEKLSRLETKILK
jgi:BMFP domain-containing protein YqiC